MNFKITILLFIALLSVSTSPIVAKYLDNVSAISISFWRMFIASILLWLYSSYKKKSKIQKKENLSKIIFAGILLGVHFALFFQAIKLTKIANATFLGTLAPIFTLFLEVFFLKRRFNKYIILGLLLSLFGAIIILSHNFDLSQEYTVGNILAIMCSLCLGASFIIAEKVRQHETTIVYTRTLYLTASITLLLIALITNSNLIGYTNNEYLWLIFLGVVPTIIGHNAIYYSVKYVPPTVVSAFPLGEPVIATILAFFIFGEYISLIIYIGGTVTLFGLY